MIEFLGNDRKAKQVLQYYYAEQETPSKKERKITSKGINLIKKIAGK